MIFIHQKIPIFAKPFISSTMKNYLISLLFILILITMQVKAQETKQKSAGFGIEAGVGYNTMNVTIKKNNGTDSTKSLNQLWMQPCIRVHYDMVLMRFGSNKSLKLKPFVGYYTYGGKLKESSTRIFSFSAIELGTGLSLDVNNRFQITPLLKGHYITKVSERTKTPQDVTKYFKSFGANVGLQLRFKYKRFTVGGEAWMGLTNCMKTSGNSGKENNYRLLIGYEF